MDKKYQLHFGNCLEIMPQLEQPIDAIVTDPPYNVSQKGVSISRGNSTIFEGGDINLDFGEWDHGDIIWQDYIDTFEKLLTEVGVLSMFYDKIHLGQIALYLAEKYNFQTRHMGTMIKRNPAPQARKVKWQNGTEMFLITTKNKGAGHHFNYKLGQSPDYITTTTNYKHLHPTQKPLHVMKWIIQYWTHLGDIVLDPFMGAGTTGVACVETGRKFIGIEVSQKYFDIAKERIKQSMLQLTFLQDTDNVTDYQIKQEI